MAPLPPTQTFALPQGTSASALGAGDFDGDGQKDLAWIRSDTPAILEVLPGVGAGALGAPVAVLTDGAIPHGRMTAAADLNGDGIDDLFASVLDGELEWRGWAGSASGLAAPTWTLAGDDLAVSAPGDLDGDGIDDLVVGVVPWLGSADGPVAQAPIDGSFVYPDSRVWPVGDPDGDGRADLLVPRHVPGGGYGESPEGPLEYLPGSSSTATWAWQARGGSGALAAVGDFDGDGTVDVAAFDLSREDEAVWGSLALLQDIASPTGPTVAGFTPFDFDIGEGLELFAIGDTDGDGAEEIGWAVEGAIRAWAWDPAAATFVPTGTAWEHPPNRQISDLLVARLDGDALPDLVVSFVGSGSASVSVWLTSPATGETGDTGAVPTETGDTGAPGTTPPVETADTGAAPAPAPEPGCGCASSSAVGGWLALLVPLAFRRRIRNG